MKPELAGVKSGEVEASSRTKKQLLALGQATHWYFLGNQYLEGEKPFTSRV